MRTKSTKKKVAKAPAAAKNTGLNVNLEYVEQIADEATSTIMALRAVIEQLVAEKEDK